MTHTLELSDSLTITESLARSGNNIKTSLTDVILLVVVLTSAYQIKRAGDTAFIRSHIY